MSSVRDPSYAQHRLSVSASHLSSLASLGRLASREPFVITQNGIVVDGYARWELARRQGCQTILCLEYDLTDEESLRWLIQSHRPAISDLTWICAKRLEKGRLTWPQSGDVQDKVILTHEELSLTTGWDRSDQNPSTRYRKAPPEGHAAA
jgi:hypothetical protein